MQPYFFNFNDMIKIFKTAPLASLKCYVIPWVGGHFWLKSPIHVYVFKIRLKYFMQALILRIIMITHLFCKEHNLYFATNIVFLYSKYEHLKRRSLFILAKKKLTINQGQLSRWQLISGIMVSTFYNEHHSFIS